MNTCPKGGELPLSDRILARAGCSPWQVYTEAEPMAQVSEIMAQECGSPLCRLPLDNTVEARQWGACIGVSPLDNSALIKKPLVRQLSDLPDLPDWDMAAGPVLQVLRGVRRLYEDARIPVLNIEGPFSILAMLSSTTALYKELRKKEALVEELCRRIIRQLALYVKLAEAEGVRIVSYADSVVVPDLLSPKLQQGICRRVTLEGIRTLAEAAPGIVLHICCRSMGLLAGAGQIRIVPVAVENMSYGEALAAAEAPNAGFPRIIVNGCLQQPERVLPKQYVNFLEFV